MANCLGNNVESGCIFYMGPDIPVFGIVSGDSLDEVISKIASYQTPVLPESTMPTTDDIVSKSPVRNTSSICASGIIKRDFAYSLTKGAAGVTVTYDLVDIVRNLPHGYELGVTRVLATGQPVNGLSTIIDARSISMSFNIPMDRYPASISFLMRIIAPCGQVDLTYTLNLINPAISGSFRAVMEANDLNPTSGEVKLTDQLNTIESRLQIIEGRVQDATAGGETLKAQELTITDLKEKVDNPSSFTVQYVKDGGTQENESSTIITDLYAQIKTLNDKISNQQSEITNLKNTISST